MIKFKKRTTIEDRFQNMDAEAGFTFDEFGRLTNVRRPLKEAMEFVESKSDAEKLYAFLDMEEDLAESRACEEDCNEKVEESDESLTEEINHEGKKLYHCDDCGADVWLFPDEYDGMCPECHEHHGFYEVEDESLTEDTVKQNGK